MGRDRGECQDPANDVDDAPARSRATGGVPDPSKPDQGSTTGTTPTELFVGRVSGEDVGYAGDTGAERREKSESEQDEQDAHYEARDGERR